MASLGLVAVGGVGLDDLQPYIPLGLALGGVYALSGVGIVVLYRTTGVINLAFGAVGAAGGLIAWYVINHGGWPEWLAYLVAVAFGGTVTLAYGLVFGPALAARDPLVKMMGTLGLALVVLGLMAWRAPPIAASVRILHLPTSDWTYRIAGATVSWTHIMALLLGLGLTVGTTAFLRLSRLGTAMRALANDREITATLGVPVRRVEAAAWLGSGLVSGMAGLVLADQLGTLDYAGLSFPLVIAALAAALVGRLRSLPATLVGGLAIGLVQGCLAAYFSWPSPALPFAQYRGVTPFVLAIVALLWLARRRSVAMSGGR